MQRFERESIEMHCNGDIWPTFLGSVEIGEFFIIETAEVGPTGPIEVKGILKRDNISIHI